MMKTLAFISILIPSQAAGSEMESLVTESVGFMTTLKHALVANGKTEQLVHDKYFDKFHSLNTLAAFDYLLDGKCNAQKQSNDVILSPNTNLNEVEMSHASRTRNILDQVLQMEPHHKDELQAVIRSLDSKNGTILSFGANDGTELLELLRRFPNSQAWGYEIDKKTVEENQQRLKSVGVHTFTSKFDDLPEHGFDFIACNFVMLCKMSSSQFEGFMKTFGRLLKKDGMLELVVYDQGVHPKSGFDPRVIRKYMVKYPTQPVVYRSIPHPDRDAPLPTADGQQQAIQEMMRKSQMELFMLWPNSIDEETSKRHLRTSHRYAKSILAVPKDHSL